MAPSMHLEWHDHVTHASFPPSRVLSFMSCTPMIMKQHHCQATTEVDQLRKELDRQLDLNRLAQAQIKPTLELLCEVQRENGRLSSELEHLRAENSRMKETIDQTGTEGHDKEHPINLNDTPESVRALKDELAHLKQQYDELFHEKELAGRRYQEHYRKWRNFKKWLANEQAAQSSDPTNQFSTPSTARLHKIQRILHRPVPDSDNENDDLPLCEPTTMILQASPTRSNIPLLPLQDVPLSSSLSSPSSHPRVLSEPASPNTSSTKYVINSKCVHEGDCKCHQDDVINPHPMKLKPPLWRTPKKNQKVKERESIYQYMPNIAHHQIQPELPQTPPGYWNIGFPDTQEIELINRQAQSLHKK